MIKNPPAMQETQVQSLGWEDPLEQEMASTLILLPGESHGQRRLVSYSPWGCRELDVYTHTHSDTAGNLKPRNCHGPGPVLPPGHQEDVTIQLCYPCSMGRAQAEMSLTAVSS